MLYKLLGLSPYCLSKDQVWSYFILPAELWSSTNGVWTSCTHSWISPASVPAGKGYTSLPGRAVKYWGWSSFSKAVWVVQNGWSSAKWVRFMGSIRCCRKSRSTGAKQTSVVQSQRWGMLVCCLYVTPRALGFMAGGLFLPWLLAFNENDRWKLWKKKH